MTVIGLTGGIACGKSTVSRLAIGQDWHCIDSDAIAHELMQPHGTNWKKIIDVFGPEVLNEDQSINRKALGDLVFGQPPLREKLNELTHPAIRKAWQAELQQFQKSHPKGKVLLMIPLLFEAGLEMEVESVLCVACSQATQCLRLEGRGWTPEQTHLRMESQMPLSEKMARSRWVIWNEGTLQALETQVARWMDQIN